MMSSKKFSIRLLFYDNIHTGCWYLNVPYKVLFNHIFITVVLSGMVVLKNIVLNLMQYRNDVNG